MRIFKKANTLSISMFMIFTSICYYTYRDESQDLFTMTLPMNLISNLVRIGVSFNAMFSYPMNILTCFDTVEKSDFFNKYKHPNASFRRLVSRSSIVLTITAISMIIPNFTDFINIVGALTSSILSFVLPELLYLQYFKGKISKPYKYFCYFIIGFGIFGGVYSFSYTISQLL